MASQIETQNKLENFSDYYIKRNGDLKEKSIQRWHLAYDLYASGVYASGFFYNQFRLYPSGASGCALITDAEGYGKWLPYSWGHTITVASFGGNFTTIQAAINSILNPSASNRWTVIVFPGTYDEKITGREYVDIVAVGGRESTIIQQTDVTNVVTLYNNEVFKGFTVKLNDATSAKNAIKYYGYSTVENVWIVDCDIYFTGNFHSYGINTDYTSAAINGLYISGCTVTGPGSGYGYGITIGGAAVTYHNIYVTNNIIKDIKIGAFIYTNSADSTDYVVMENNYIDAGTWCIYIGPWNHSLADHYGILKSYNNTYLTGVIYLSATGTTSTTYYSLFYSYGDTLVGVTKAGLGGSETAYIFNDVQNGITTTDNKNTTANASQILSDTVTTGGLLYCYSNSSDGSSRNLVSIVNDNASATSSTALSIQQDAATNAFSIDQNANGVGIYIDSQATSASPVDVEGDTITTGNVINIDNASALTTGSIAYFYSNSSDSSARKLLNIVNDNTSATSTNCLYIQQDSTAEAIVTQMDGIGATFDGDAGISLKNTTASTSGAKQQCSPALIFSGQGYGSGADVRYQWSIFNLPVAGSDLSVLYWYTKKATAAWTYHPFRLYSNNQQNYSLTSVGEVSTQYNLVYENTSAATVGSDQWSPTMRFISYGWKTASTAGSQAMALTYQNCPEQGVTNPIGVHKTMYGTNASSANANEIYRLEWGDRLGVVFNDLSLDGYNLRIEGNSDANLFVTNGANDEVGIGTSSPTEKLSVSGVMNAYNYFSDVETGTSPYFCRSTTLNTNLNADLWDGHNWSEIEDGYVPYTGANKDVDLGSFDISTTGSGIFGLASAIGDAAGGTYWSVDKIDLGWLGQIPLLRPMATFLLGNYGAMAKAIYVADPASSLLYAGADNLSDNVGIAWDVSKPSTLIFNLNGNTYVNLTTTELAPENDLELDLGLVDHRWKNVYGEYFYGDGSNLTGISTVTDFLSLTDTPASYSNMAASGVRVKADETGLEFYGISNGGGSGSDTHLTITQASHGFSVGDIVRHNGSIYVKAKADSAANSEVVGIVSAVNGENSFNLLSNGYVTGLSSLSAGSVYFLSDATAGLLTLTEPTTNGHISKPLLIAISTTSGFFFNMRGMVAGTGGMSFGAWESMVNEEIYLASTDGFVLGNSGTNGQTPRIVTDSSASPSTVRSREYTGGSNSSVMSPVRKGDYWQALDCTAFLFWIPCNSGGGSGGGSNSVFSSFSGDGSQGSATVSSATDFSTIDDPFRPGYAQFTDLTIDAGQTLTIDTKFAFIGVQGLCTIHGTISADGKGGSAGDDISHSGFNGVGIGGVHGTGVSASGHKYWDGTTSGINSQEMLDFSVAGAGGGAGGGSSGGGSPGGAGGGSGGYGGAGGGLQVAGTAGGVTSQFKLLQLTGGLGNNAEHITYFNPSILRCYGGGGGMAYHSNVGHGGGIIYIECGSLVFDGTLTADGANATNGASGEGGGGGGGGGIVLVRATNIATNSGTVTVTGGTGGSGGGSGAAAGGAGAPGFKDIVEDV